LYFADDKIPEGDVLPDEIPQDADVPIQESVQMDENSSSDEEQAGPPHDHSIGMIWRS